MSRTDIQLLTCNVQRANVTRTLRQVAWLASSNADALVLTEVSAGESGDLLARSLTEIGFGVLIPKPAANDRYRILVACRDVEPTSVEIGAGSIGHRCAAARIAFPAGEIGVLGLYVPSRGPKDRRNQDKRAFQDCAAMLLPRVTAALDVSGPVVVAGDLNVVEPDHDPHYAVFGGWEYDFYRTFGRSGFEDAFRLKEPSTMEYSWFGRPSTNGKRNGYRFDHAFVSHAHRTAVTACQYDHSPRTAGLTDHSALTVTLDLAATTGDTGHAVGVGSTA